MWCGVYVVCMWWGVYVVCLCCGVYVVCMWCGVYVVCMWCSVHVVYAIYRVWGEGCECVRLHEYGREGRVCAIQ